MLIRRPEDVSPQTMTMPGARGVQMRLMVGRGDGAPTFAMRLFDVEPGGHTPHHQHNYEHEVMILEGQGRLQHESSDTGGRSIRAGDVVFIPANQLHQFRNTGPSNLRFMCMVPTHFDCGQQQCQPTPGS